MLFFHLLQKLFDIVKGHFGVACRCERIIQGHVIPQGVGRVGASEGLDRSEVHHVVGRRGGNGYLVFPCLERSQALGENRLALDAIQKKRFSLERQHRVHQEVTAAVLFSGNQMNICSLLSSQAIKAIILRTSWSFGILLVAIYGEIKPERPRSRETAIRKSVRLVRVICRRMGPFQLAVAVPFERSSWAFRAVDAERHIMAE